MEDNVDKHSQLTTGKEMIRAMNRGVREALREHKRLGQSIVVWDRENKRVVEIPAEEIVVPEDDEAAPKDSRP